MDFVIAPFRFLTPLYVLEPEKEKYIIISSQCYCSREIRQIFEDMKMTQKETDDDYKMENIVDIVIDIVNTTTTAAAMLMNDHDWYCCTHNRNLKPLLHPFVPVWRPVDLQIYLMFGTSGREKLDDMRAMLRLLETPCYILDRIDGELKKIEKTKIFSWSSFRNDDTLPYEIIFGLNRLNINAEVGSVNNVGSGGRHFVMLVHCSVRMMKKFVRFGLTYELVEKCFVIGEENYIVKATDWMGCFTNRNSSYDLFGPFKVSILLCRCCRTLSVHDDDNCTLFRSQLPIVKEALLLQGYEIVWNSPSTGRGGEEEKKETFTQ